MTQPQVDKAVQESVDRTYAEMSAKRNCRGVLTMLAVQIGGLPNVRAIAQNFTDRVRYPTRPMVTLHSGSPSVYLLGWREEEFTEIHDHGSCEVGVYVVQGIVMEDLYVPATPTNRLRDEGDTCQVQLAMSRLLRQGEVLTCPEQYVHRIGNIFPEVATTLHVYGPVLDKMRLFSMFKGVLQFTGCWGCSDTNAAH